MKKWIQAGLLLVSLLVLSTCVFATAGETYYYGVTSVSKETGYSLSLQDADGTATSYSGIVDDTTKTVYDGVEKMVLSFPGDTEQQYMVFLLKDGTVPTESNLMYIDQTTGATATSFTIYPNTLEDAGDYTVYVSSTDVAYKEVASFTVVANWVEAEYTLGDINNSGKPDVEDALYALQFALEKITLTETQISAANVWKPDTTSVDVDDAVRILQYAVEKIDEF